MAWDNTSWGVTSSPKDSIPKIQTNLDYLYNSIGGSSDIVAQIAAKAPLANPTFTGIATLPQTTSIGTTTSTELGYLHGVTSSIQSQLNAKAPSGHGSGTVSENLGNVDIDTVVVNGNYLVGVGSTNMPFSGSSGFLEVIGSNVGGTGVSQVITNTLTGISYQRLKNSNIWGSWVQNATINSFDYSTEITATDWNTLIKNGKYYVIGSSTLAVNGPLPVGDANHLFYVDVINGTSSRTNYISQQAANVVTGVLYTRKNQGGTWSAWRQISFADNPTFTGSVNSTGGYYSNGSLIADNGGALALASQKAYTWKAVVQGSTWSRIGLVSFGFSGPLGYAFILTIRATRSNVIYNNTFHVVVTGYGRSNISQLSFNPYGVTQFKIRFVQPNSANSSSSGYIEIYDSIGIVPPTTQDVYCNLRMLTQNDTLTPYTSFVDGSTIPTGYIANTTMDSTTTSDSPVFSGKVTIGSNATGSSGLSIINDSTANSPSILQSVATNGGTYGILSLNPSGGNVGIGTPLPTLNLQVSGSGADVVRLTRATTLVDDRRVGGIAFSGGNASSATAGVDYALIGGVTSVTTAGSETGAFSIYTLSGGANTERVRVTYVSFRPSASNAYTLGASGFLWSQIYAATATINTSDRNAKMDIEDLTLGLDFILAQRPVEFKYKVRQNVVTPNQIGTETVEITPERVEVVVVTPAEYETVEITPAVFDEEGNVITEAVTEEKLITEEVTEEVVIPAVTEERPIFEEVVTPLPGIRTHAGLIAQEVEETLKGKDIGIYTVGEDGSYGLRYEEFIAPLIKSIQELTARVKELESK